MDILNIYYLHYGIMENNERKKKYSIEKLTKSPLITRYKTILSYFQNCQNKQDACRTIKIMSRMMNDEYKYSFRHLDRCYRNHIFPAEIMDSDSIFYKASVSNIDAILIDRDPNIFSRSFKKRSVHDWL